MRHVKVRAYLLVVCDAEFVQEFYLSIVIGSKKRETDPSV